MFIHRVQTVLSLTVLVALPTARVAAQRSGPELLPRSVVLYAEVPQPKQMLQDLLRHPLRGRLEALENYQQVLDGQGYRQLKTVVSMVETEMDMQWDEIIGAFTAGGLHAAVDAETEGVAVLVQAQDEAIPRKLRDILLTFIRGNAQAKFQDDPVETGEYRGVQAFGVGKAKFGTFGKWFLVTNKGELGQKIIDFYLDGGDESLAANARFMAVRQSLPQSPTAWAYADVNTLRDAGVAGDLFRGRVDNLGLELILGGLLSNLKETPYATAVLNLRPESIQVTLASPHDADWVGEPREYYFGPGGDGVAPPLLRPRDTLLALSAYRDVAGMWLYAGDLFDEGVNDNLAQAESTLSTLFSGMDFGEEVLGALQPQIQVAVTRQDFTGKLPQPAIKLPSLAAVFRLRDADRMRDEFRRTFQSLVGFLNVTGATNGQPQLDFEVEKDVDRQTIVSSYVAEGSEKESRQARINFNFSPSAAFVGDRFILSSASGLVGELSEGAPAQDAEVPRVNTQAFLDAKVLRDVLDDNRDQLVAQNMLEGGHGKEEAEKNIDNILAIVGWFRDATLQFGTVDDQLQLRVQVNIDREQ